MTNPQGLTHLDEHGKAHMVDITQKEVTVRRAVAICRVSTSTAIDEAALEADIGMAVIAGIQAAKATSSLLPLCHPLPVDDTTIEIQLVPNGIDVRATAPVVARTGIEMEALCACSIAGLTLVHALLPFDPSCFIEDLTLLYTSGGQSGTYLRKSAGPGLASLRGG